jgi:hypothetical protein
VEKIAIELQNICRDDFDKLNVSVTCLEENKWSSLDWNLAKNKCRASMFQYQILKDEPINVLNIYI